MVGSKQFISLLVLEQTESLRGFQYELFPFLFGQTLLRNTIRSPHTGRNEITKEINLF